MGADQNQKPRTSSRPPAKAPEPLPQEDDPEADDFAEDVGEPHEEAVEAQEDARTSPAVQARQEPVMARTPRGLFPEGPADNPFESPPRGNRKAAVSLDHWKEYAAELISARQTVMELRERMSRSCTAQQLAPLNSIIDRFGIAFHRFDAVAYSQHGRAGIGLFNVPIPDDGE